MFEKKSIVAKLIARENIRIFQGNYDTASFNTLTRVLHMPSWVGLNEDVYDMLTAHEVGHALFTPIEAAYKMKEASFPFDWYNVVEDIRIENKMKREYPGLVAAFRRGYHHLVNDYSEVDFFGAHKNKKNFDSYNLIDRFNVKGKCRDLVEVRFDPEEQALFDKADVAETIDDVFDVCNEIYAFLKAKKKKASTPKLKLSEDSLKEVEKPIFESEEAFKEFEKILFGEESEEEESVAKKKKKEVKDTPAYSSGEVTEEELEEAEKRKFEGFEEEEESPEEGDIDEEELKAETYDKTYDSFSCLKEKNTVIAYLPPKPVLDEIVISYDKLKKLRRERFVEQLQLLTVTEDVKKRDYASFLSFKKSIRKDVNHLYQAFNMKRSAHRNLRAKVSTKGSLDVNKVHRYKFDDHLFKQVTTLADDKNHGMVMLIDNSGSMGGVISEVMNETIILSEFCKMANIPFEVYMFTSGVNRSLPKAEEEGLSEVNLLSFKNVRMIELVNSRLSKNEYYDALFHMWSRCIGSNSYSNPYLAEKESMGATPLVEALTIMYDRIHEFKRKSGVEKTSFVVLTDGFGGSIRFTRDHRSMYDIEKYVIHFRDTVLETKNLFRMGSQELQTTILDQIRKLNVSTVNYHLTQASNRRTARQQVAMGLSRNVLADLDIAEETEKFWNNGYLIKDKTSGYDCQFLINSNFGDADIAKGKKPIKKKTTAKTIAKNMERDTLKRNRRRQIAKNVAKSIA